MKVNVKNLVFLFLGLFLLKIAVADPYRDPSRNVKLRSPASNGPEVRTLSLDKTRDKSPT